MSDRRRYSARRGVRLKDFVRVARRSHSWHTKFAWYVFVFYKGLDVELEQLLHRIIGGAFIGSGSEIKTMKRDLQFGFQTEKQARAAAARVPRWIRVRTTVKRATT